MQAVFVDGSDGQGRRRGWRDWVCFGREEPQHPIIVFDGTLLTDHAPPPGQLNLFEQE